jgi:hypothetical protein
LGIPEFSNTGSNTFQITISNTSTINIDWFGMTLQDGLSGISPGGVDSTTSLPYSPVGAATGASLDLSTLVIGVWYTGTSTEAIFEYFLPTTNPFDLSGVGGFSPCFGAGGIAQSLQFVPNLPTTVPGDQGYLGI